MVISLTWERTGPRYKCTVRVGPNLRVLMIAGALSLTREEAIRFHFTVRAGLGTYGFSGIGEGGPAYEELDAISQAVLDG